MSFRCGIENIQQTSEYNKKADSWIQRINEWLPVGGGNIGVGD